MNKFKKQFVFNDMSINTPTDEENFVFNLLNF